MLRKIKRSLWGILLGLTGLWMLANTALPATWSFVAIRNLPVQCSGVIGMGVMNVAMVLALRPVWLGPRLGGLHKWPWIAGLSGAGVPHRGVDELCRVGGTIGARHHFSGTHVLETQILLRQYGRTCW